ncbi:hypothetical protein BVG16_21365 [Paenibacillus selenitireducens]|uniref:Uncharacterized protein n=1 Tax=Paenibacillus selenitireducens TaxID=1324314 RepID=A0A1T2X5L0_9BACL|nr:beta-N-acetylglucosaminidase domain-containing protein [Paenibacillus selenitireducens]OPA75159.1 hypothetical protein BVG16_21365 [Paenibacillus selenitireducens]
MNTIDSMHNNRYDIFPVPQEITYLGGEAQITEPINIIVTADLKKATWPKLQDLLTTYGYTYTVSEDFVTNTTNLYLTDQPHILQAGMENMHTGPVSEKTHKEGYTLIVRGDTTCNIAVMGHDSDGLHYGVVTLEQILRQSDINILQNCTITDYPEILYRGYVEGFYGFPWSHKDRMDLMKFGGEQKLNTYIYAPKDDPYHRKNWRDLYPAEKAQEIAELAAAGHVNHLNFVWTIHPGDTIDLASEEDYQSAIIKLEQLYTLGVRQFGILFDDLVGIPNGPEQAAFINRIDAEFIKPKGDIRPLITVGTRYCEAWGPSMTTYFKPFVETLHDDVEIMWTGAATMSNMTKEQYDAPKRAIGSERNLSVWWNYPVNDYCDSKILMGKIENLGSDLNNVNGFFANPMNQSQASKQALFCIADHNWNTDAFDCEKSYSASFRTIAPEVAEDLEIVASNCCYVKDDGGVSGDFVFDESWYLKDDAYEFISGLKQQRDVTETGSCTMKHFIRMEAAVIRIREKCMNDKLVKELDPFLDAILYMAQGAQQAIQAVNALQSGDILAMEHHHEVAGKRLKSMAQCKVHRLKEGVPHDFTVDVGTLVIQPFLKELMQLTVILAGTEQEPFHLDYEMNNIARSSLGVTATASNCANENEDADKAIKGSIAGGKWCATEIRPYLTVDLQQPRTIKQYRIMNCGHPEARETNIWNTRQAQILASHDGVNFTVIDEFMDNTEDVINRILWEEITARYIRLQIIEPTQFSTEGSGHTRIYAFELYDEAYPDPSPKVPSSDIDIDPSGKVMIHHVKKGDVISLYRTLTEETPFAVSEQAVGDSDSIVFEDVDLLAAGDRIFVERTSKNYLPSIRTSKGYDR